MSIKSRLRKLEQVLGPPSDSVPWAVAVDKQGKIFWVSPGGDPEWIGKHSSELPAGRPIKRYGFNPETRP